MSSITVYIDDKAIDLESLTPKLPPPVWNEWQHNIVKILDEPKEQFGKMAWCTLSSINDEYRQFIRYLLTRKDVLISEKSTKAKIKELIEKKELITQETLKWYNRRIGKQIYETIVLLNVKPTTELLNLTQQLRTGFLADGGTSRSEFMFNQLNVVVISLSKLDKKMADIHDIKLETI